MGRTVEVEGAALWVDLRPGYLTETHGTGPQWKTLLIYLDDIIVISPDFQTHVSRLREVFKRLRGAGLKLKPSKSALLQPEVKYLGHVVGHETAWQRIPRKYGR